MARRMGAKTIELKASHLSLSSHPDTITQLILEAAGQRAYQEGSPGVAADHRPEAGA